MEKTLNMKTVIVLLVMFVGVAACTEFHPLTPPEDPSFSGSVTACVAPPIEKNIIGTWHFISNHPLGSIVRTGTVTFDDKHIIDPDSLFGNHIIIGNDPLRDIIDVVEKRYDTDGTYPSTFGDYHGKIFRVDLIHKNNTAGEIWPFYVASNECDKIVIYQPSSYNIPLPGKIGFTLTR